MTARRAFVTTFAAAALAALVAPLDRPGIGWLIAAVGVVAAVRIPGPGVPAGQRWSRRLAGVAAVLLVAVAAIRAAGWLVAMCACAAVLLASYAAAGGDRATRVLGGLVGVFAEPARAATWLRGGVPTERRSAVRGLLIAAPLVGLFALLLVAAEPRFAHWLRGGLPSAGGFWLAILGFVLVAALTGTLAHMRANGRTERIELPAAIGRARPTAEWAIPVALVDVLFTAYVLVDLPVLFGGDGYVLRPGGPDYAAYAIAGFIALAVVTALTVAVAAAVALVARRETRADRLLVRALAGPPCALALVIAASAVDRVSVYSTAYGFTALRLVGVTAELFLAAVLVLVLAAGVRLRAAWLPRAVVAAAVAALFALVAVNPDALAARTVIARFHRDGHLDLAYLITLSADAAAEIDKLEEPERSCVLSTIAVDDHDSWYTYNFARARLAADARGIPPYYGCPVG